VWHEGLAAVIPKDCIDVLYEKAESAVGLLVDGSLSRWLKMADRGIPSRHMRSLDVSWMMSVNWEQMRYSSVNVNVSSTGNSLKAAVN